MNPANKGFTIIETLIALLTAGIVGSGLFLMLVTLQENVYEISLACERNENLRLLPLVLAQTLQSAGCGRSSQRVGVEPLGNQLAIRSDISGPNGFPDGTLDQSYENLRIRLSESTLQLRSGLGRFQPLVLYIKRFDFKYQNLTDLSLRIEGEKRSEYNPDSGNVFEFKFYLWNFQSCLFEKEAER